MISRIITIIIGTAALAAAVISYNLTVEHITGSSGLSWFEAACSDESGPGKMNCAKVLSSPYSYFPPKGRACSEAATPSGRPTTTCSNTAMK